jgi:hypothetical protein
MLTAFNKISPRRLPMSEPKGATQRQAEVKPEFPEASEYNKQCQVVWNGSTFDKF